MRPALRLDGAGGSRRWRGTWAALPVVTDFPYPGLVASSEAAPGTAPAVPRDAAGWREIEGELGGRPHRVRLLWEEGVAWLASPTLGGCRVDLGAGLARWSGPAAARRHAPEVLAGPCLALLLAARGCYTLHAAAVRRGDEVLLLLGPSGAGKSTLARMLAGGSGGRLLCDDLVPIQLQGEGAALRGTLPQPGALPAITVPPTATATRLVLLDPNGLEPELATLDPASGALAIGRHTVAARLFSPALLAAHLAFCARLGSAPGVLRLSYARHPAKLPAMLEQLYACLGV